MKFNINGVVMGKGEMWEFFLRELGRTSRDFIEKASSDRAVFNTITSTVEEFIAFIEASVDNQDKNIVIKYVLGTFVFKKEIEEVE